MGNLYLEEKKASFGLESFAFFERHQKAAS